MITKAYLKPKKFLTQQYRPTLLSSSSTLKPRFAKKLVDEEKFTSMNQSFMLSQDLLKDKISYITNSKPQIVEVARNVMVERVVQEPIIQTQKVIEAQDRFVTTNQSFIRNRDIVQEKIAYITKVVPQIIEIEKNILIERTVEKPIIKTLYRDRVLELSKVIEVENNIFTKEIIEKPMIKTIENTIVKTIPQIVEVEKNVLVEKVVEKPVIQRVDRTIIERVPKVIEVEKSILVEKVVEKPIIKTIDNTIVKTISQIVEVEKNVLVEKVVEKPVIQRVDRTIIERVPKIVEVEKNVLLEKVVEKPVPKIVEVVVPPQMDAKASMEVTGGNRDMNFSFPILPKTKPNRMDKIQTSKQTTQNKKPQKIHESIEQPQGPIIEKHIIEQNITQYIQSGDVDINVILPDIEVHIEGILQQRFDMLLAGLGIGMGASQLFSRVSLLDVDIDDLATRIFNQLKDELDIEYRRL